MSSEQPTRFENYPGADPSAPEPAPEDVTQAAPPALADPWTRPYRSPQPVFARTRGGRGAGRLAAGAIAVPVAIVALLGGAFVANRQAEPFDSGYDVPGVVVPDDPGYEVPDPDDGAAILSVGDYTVELPEGWTTVEEDGDVVVISKGTNRVEARVIPAVDGEPVDALPDLAEEARDRFVGELGEAVDTAAGEDVARATLTATGTIGKRDARFRADLWQDGYSDTALLVVQTLTAGKDSATAAAAKEFTAELAAQVG